MKRSEFVSEQQFKTVNDNNINRYNIMKTALAIAKRLSHPQPMKIEKEISV